MDIIRLRNLIEQGIENEYLDFKIQFHENKAELLHDILCLANNTQFQDAYLVFGINDSGETVGVENNQKRINSANIHDFLNNIRSKFFNNDLPDIDVLTLKDSGHDIDILEIKSTLKVPYFLTECYQDGKITVRSGHVYSRTGDRNTPIDQFASPSQIESLWKKRNYLLEKPLDNLLHLLDYPAKWIKETTEDFDPESYYYENNPEYRIVISLHIDEENFHKKNYLSFAQINPSTMLGDYKCVNNNTCLKSGALFILDSGRTTVPAPLVKPLGNKLNINILVDYFILNSIEFKLLKFLNPEQQKWDNVGLQKFLNHTLVFFSIDERDLFFKTIEANASTYYRKIIEQISENYFDQEASQCDKERLSAGFILKEELDNFRSSNNPIMPDS